MVRVRYRPNELGDEGVVETLQADSFRVMEDHTVKLYKYNDETEKNQVVGFIHAHRWESILQVEDANDSNDF